MASPSGSFPKLGLEESFSEVLTAAAAGGLQWSTMAAQRVTSVDGFPKSAWAPLLGGLSFTLFWLGGFPY